MIPKIYSGATKDFNTNGLGPLSDAVRCEVTEERNGGFELEMEYPISGIHYSDIKNDCIIKANVGDGRLDQLFSVYNISKPIGGIVTIQAEHISYRLTKIPVSPFAANDAQQAMAGLKENSSVENQFSFWTDKNVESVFQVIEPSSIRSNLGGKEGSILDVYGGEYEFDNYNVKLWTNRGIDSGVVVKYGKNLTDLKQEENISNVITGIYPFWKKEDTIVDLPEKVVMSSNAEKFSYPRVIAKDFSQDFEEQPSEEQLRKKANEYVNNGNLGVPSVSITFSFFPLWQTEEYKEYAPIERVRLCDTITVEYEKLGVSAKAKIIKTVWDVINERYINLEIGEAKTNLVDDIINQGNDTLDKINQSQSWMEEYINNATNWLTSANGNIVAIKDSEGRWKELVAIDTDDIVSAQNVLRLNNNGIGFSRTGINGPYRNAWTIDGTLIGDFLAANSVRASQLSVGDFSNYATVTEFNENTMLPSDFKFGGTKRYNPGGIWELQRLDPTKSQYLMLCDYTPNCFKDGDELNAEFEFYPDIDGQKAISIYFYDQNKVFLTAYSANFSGELRKWQKYSLDIKMDYIRSDAYYFIIGFDMHDITKNDVVRRCQIRRKGGSNLIVNGSIQAKSLSFGLGSNLYNCGYDTLDNITNDTIYFKKNDYEEGRPIIVSVGDHTKEGIYPIYGTRCIRVVNTTTDGYVYLGSQQNGYGCIPIRYGQKYRISCYAMTSLDLAYEADCQLFLAEHKNRDTNTVYHESSAKMKVGKSWKRFEMTYTADASRANPYISLRINVNNNAVVFWCCFQIEEIAFDGQETGTFKPAGTTLIDGSHVITKSLDASKIYVTDLKAFNATIGDWNIETDYLWTEFTPGKYGIIKAVGDVMIAVNSPRKEDTTGATWQLFFDGHMAFGDTAGGKTRSELYGDRWNMYNDQGFAFRVISVGGAELYGDPDKNPTPYWDFHYNGDTGDYSVRLRCTGYDTLVVEGGTLNTSSDISLKEEVRTLDKQFETFFRGIAPISFRYKEKSNKMQIGYNANNIEEAILNAGMNPDDMGLYHVDAEGIRSLAYMEFAPLNTYMIQKCMERITSLEEEMLKRKGEMLHG